MRQFTQKEKEIIGRIVTFKRISRLEELQVARLLRKELVCFAVKWSVGPKKELSFYSFQGNVGGSVNWELLRKSYFQVSDFLYLVEELEGLGFIKIQTLNFEIEKEEDRILYDRERFSYDSDRDTFSSKEGEYLLPIDAKHKVYIDFVDYLEKYANKVIYPLPLLEDWVDNEYKTLEERNFEKQIQSGEEHHREQMKVNRNSFIVACIALALSFIVPFGVSKCEGPIKVEEKQWKSLIQAVGNYSKDSVIIRQINPSANKISQ